MGRFENLDFRQDHMSDPGALAAFRVLLRDMFGIDVSVQDRLGGLDPTLMPFAYFDQNGRCVANLSAFFMPVMIDGEMTRAAGFQSGAVQYDWRGRDLMTRAFGWADDRGFELGLLLTDKPALYEPYGFRVVAQHFHCGPPPKPALDSGAAKLLLLDDADDVTLMRGLLARRTPVSRVFSVAAQTEMFLLNASFDREIQISLMPDRQSVIAWRMRGDVFYLLDIAGPQIPELGEVIGALGASPRQVEVSFTPDRLNWQSTVRPYEFESVLMARGNIKASSPIMLSPMAEF